MKVPVFFRQLFDNFPLKYYESNDKKEDKSFFDEKEYRFIPSESFKHGENKITLAVHNVRKISFDHKTVKFIPTDPEGLYAALLLCDRYKMLLPMGTTGNGHAIVPLSYLASHDGELPMFVETTKERDSSLKVGSTIDMLHGWSGSEGETLVSIFDDFLHNLCDLWSLILLAKIPIENSHAFTNLFHRDPEFECDNEFSKQLIFKLVNDIQSWNSLSLKYPNISSSTTVGKAQEWLLLNSENRKITEKVCAIKLAEFESLIPQFLCYFNSGDLSGAKKTLQLRFVSFVICIEYLLSFGVDLLLAQGSDFHDALSYSKQVLMQF